MMKRILTLPLLALLLFSVPAGTLASGAFGVEQQVESPISISVSNATVLITGAEGQTLEVISLSGRKLMAVQIESPAQRIELNVPKGCYILKIGKLARKVSIR